MFSYSSSVLAFLISFCLISFSCQKDEYEKTYAGFVFGSTYKIITKSTQKEINLQKKIDSIFKIINYSLSTYDTTSLISKINKNQDIAINSVLKEMVELSQNANKETEGYFDPGIGYLIDLWNKKKYPNENELKKIVSQIGIKQIKIEKKQNC